MRFILSPETAGRGGVDLSFDYFFGLEPDIGTQEDKLPFIFTHSAMKKQRVPEQMNNTTRNVRRREGNVVGNVQRRIEVYDEMSP